MFYKMDGKSFIIGYVADRHILLNMDWCKFNFTVVTGFVNVLVIISGGVLFDSLLCNKKIK